MPVYRKSAAMVRSTQSAAQKANDVATPQQTNGVYCAIGHPTFPSLPHLSVASSLILDLTLSITAAMVQYLNLYKTVWWLPSSPQASALEFESIDCYLLWHVSAMLVVPCIYNVMIELFSSYILRFPLLRSLLSVPLLIAWFYLAVHPLLHVDFTHFSTSVHRFGACASFCYIPFVAVAIYHDDQILRLAFLQNLHTSTTYRPKTTPKGILKSVKLTTTISDSLTRVKQILVRFYHVTSDWPALKSTSCLFPVRYMARASKASVESFTSGRFTDLLPTAYYTKPLKNWDNKEESIGNCSDRLTGLVLLQHRCVGVTADQVRDEIELYRRDFNSRLTDVFFGTLYSVYYSCLLPFLFVRPASLFYDSTWCVQHILMVTVVSFLFRWNRCVPPDYVDLLYRSCQHLGDWEPVQQQHHRHYSAGPGKPSHPTSSTATAANPGVPTVWSPIKIYPRDVIVRHLRGYYRSLGNVNAAEPGSSYQHRFYMVFHAPVRLSAYLLVASVGLLVFLLGSLHWVFEWYKILGLAATGSFALFNLYYCTRNYRLVRNVYATMTTAARQCATACAAQTTGHVELSKTATTADY